MSMACIRPHELYLADRKQQKRTTDKSIRACFDFRWLSSPAACRRSYRCEPCPGVVEGHGKWGRRLSTESPGGRCQLLVSCWIWSGWWKKSCWYGKYPIIYRVFIHHRWLAGFLPSKVLIIEYYSWMLFMIIRCWMLLIGIDAFWSLLLPQFIHRSYPTYIILLLQGTTGPLVGSKSNYEAGRCGQM